jgi:hypothetical protein
MFASFTALTHPFVKEKSPEVVSGDRVFKTAVLKTAQ